MRESDTPLGKEPRPINPLSLEVMREENVVSRLPTPIDPDLLISFTYYGDQVYLADQFTVLEDRSLHVEASVLQFWYTYVTPVIESGRIDEFSMISYLFNRSSEKDDVLIDHIRDWNGDPNAEIVEVFQNDCAIWLPAVQPSA